MIQLIPWFSERGDISLPLPLASRAGTGVKIFVLSMYEWLYLKLYLPYENIVTYIWNTLSFAPVQTPSYWTATKLSYRHKIQNWSIIGIGNGMGGWWLVHQVNYWSIITCTETISACKLNSAISSVADHDGDSFCYRLLQEWNLCAVLRPSYDWSLRSGQ